MVRTSDMETLENECDLGGRYTTAKFTIADRKEFSTTDLKRCI